MNRNARTPRVVLKRGFVAPYADLRVTLVDLRRGAVVRSEIADETQKAVPRVPAPA